MLLSFGRSVGPAGGIRGTRTAGRRDLIGACAPGRPSLACPPPDRGVPYLTAATEEARHDQHGKITSTASVVVGGVDTHGQTHHAAVIDEVGRELGDREFPASPAGYRALAAGSVIMVSLNGSGSRAPAPTVPR